ncbi:hypothetical protein DFJ73DRAFT_865155 [Zopfochytrium polystomum]|nr:hypothetical protein DFJ73DRAFT_865155 [Zopfochytrium polystomum]
MWMRPRTRRRQSRRRGPCQCPCQRWRSALCWRLSARAKGPRQNQTGTAAAAVAAGIGSTMTTAPFGVGTGTPAPGPARSTNTAKQKAAHPQHCAVSAVARKCHDRRSRCYRRSHSIRPPTPPWRKTRRRRTAQTRLRRRRHHRSQTLPGACQERTVRSMAGAVDDERAAAPADSAGRLKAEADELMVQGRGRGGHHLVVVAKARGWRR